MNAATNRALAIYQSKTLPAIDGIGQVMSDIGGFLEKETEKALAHQQTTAGATTRRIVLIAMVALVAGIGFSFFITRYLTSRIRKLTDFSSLLARDISQVSRVSGEINDSSNRVSSDAGNLSSASRRIKEMIQAFKIDTSVVDQTSVSPRAENIPDLVQWSQSIQLDIKSIDRQHKRLVDLINELNRSMRMRKGREAMTRILGELVGYTQTHFGHEEQLMRTHGYAELSDHEAQHRHFIDKMKALQAQVNSGNAMVTMDLIRFLKDWLIKHIKGTDKNYQDFFKSKGVA